MTGFDLDAYCRRIGYDGPRTPDLATLREVAMRHLCAIPFENLDPLLGLGPSVAPADVEAKLVLSHRGGYCFEHNPLFQRALTAMGFSVRALGGRVMQGQSAEALTPRTHALLQVGAEGSSYLVDVGFGGATPTAPLAFSRADDQETPHGPYRLESGGDEFELFGRIDAEWTLLYRFDGREHFPVDHEVANHYVATHPTSFFRNAIVAAIVTPDGRYTLFNDRLTFRGLDGSRTERRLPDAAALVATLEETFGISVPEQPALAAAFDRSVRR